MGSAEGLPNEMPIHAVTLPDYELMKAEVTVSQFNECVAVGVCGSDNYDSNNDSVHCNFGNSEREEHPMNCVNWTGAAMYCAWVDARLPTEAEWEFAARSGGLSRDFPWGDEGSNCDLAIMYEAYAGCGIGSSWPVCSKTLGNTDQGVCDMAGNIQEWVEDDYHSEYYDEDYGEAPTDGTAWNTGESSKVLRGGSFGVISSGLRATARRFDDPSTLDQYNGFRCARNAL